MIVGAQALLHRRASGGPHGTEHCQRVSARFSNCGLAPKIISPAALINPDPRDRPYAAALSAGLHTHFATPYADMSLGADLVATGPATHLDELQGAFHDLLGISQPSAAVVDAQNRKRTSSHPCLSRPGAIFHWVHVQPCAHLWKRGLGSKPMPASDWTW